MKQVVSHEDRLGPRLATRLRADHAWLQAGEDVVITLRRQAIATLIPRPPTKRAKRPMPNLGARLRKVFGRRILRDQSGEALLDQDRGAY